MGDLGGGSLFAVLSLFLPLSLLLVRAVEVVRGITLPCCITISSPVGACFNGSVMSKLWHLYPTGSLLSPAPSRLMDVHFLSPPAKHVSRASLTQETYHDSIHKREITQTQHRNY